MSLRSLPGRVYSYFLCQALSATALVMSVTMSAILGNKLAIAGGFSPALATLPYGMQFFALMVVTYPASMIMKKIGRRQSFMLATALLMGSGVLGYWAASAGLFVVLCLAHMLLGGYVAFSNYFRFAVTDGLPSNLKAKSMSLVVSGGVIAAFTGPNFSNLFRNFLDFEEFSAAYGLFVILAICVFLLVAFTPSPPAPITTNLTTDSPPNPNSIPGDNKHRGDNRPTLYLAIFVGAAAYGLMNLLMTQSSLMMHNLQVQFQDVAFAIQMHVLAMFVPSFFTGSLIARLGNKAVLLVGFTFLVACSLLNISSQSYGATVLGLILLGLGWNFGYIGGGALLNESVSEQEAHRVQGINDTTIGITTFTTAFGSSVLYHFLGWQGTNVISLTIAMIGLGLIYFFKFRSPAVSVKNA